MSNSEWLTPDGRKAAELLGPIEWSGTKAYARRLCIIAHAAGFVFAEYDVENGAYLGETDNTLAVSLQNEHARHRLAEKGIIIRLCDDGQYVVEAIATFHREARWLVAGRFLSLRELHAGGLSAEQFKTYEAALIAAVLAVYGKETK